MNHDDRHQGDALSALLDGELDAAERAAALRHVDTCPACAAELAGVEAARSWVRALPPVEPPAGYLDTAVAAVVARSGEPSPATVTPFRRRRIGMGVAALAATAAISVGLLALVTPDDPPASPPVAQLVRAHATAEAGADPVSQLAPTAVPVTFRP